MSNIFTFQQLLQSGGSIFLAAFIALYLFPKVSLQWFPVMSLVCIAAVNELLSIYLISQGNYSHTNNNIYVLVEAVLILLQFKTAGTFTYRPKLFMALCAGILFVWLLENFYISSISKFYPMFRIFSALIMVGLSIYYINILAVFSRKKLYKDAQFILAVAWLIFFSSKVITEIFWISALRDSHMLKTNIFDIFLYINLFVNILYALALICIPTKYSNIKPSA